jgi:hypothetical protein
MGPRILRRVVFALLPTILFLLNEGDGHARTLFSLQQEDVFCLYFRLSGQPMGNQDIEDLCFALGRPIYSAFKPAEMFMNPSIQEMRKRLQKKMKEYGSDPVFLWRFVVPPALSRLLHWASAPPEELPHATPFIRSVMSEKGWSRIEAAARTRLSIRHEPLQITVHARATGIDQLPEKRIVAQEELRIPIRFIVFQPLDVQVSRVSGS